jgi:hypothetical protein
MSIIQGGESIMFELTWTDFKAVAITSKALKIQYAETSVRYYLTAIDGFIALYECEIPKSSPASTDQSDFETNYKTAANALIGPTITDITTKKHLDVNAYVTGGNVSFRDNASTYFSYSKTALAIAQTPTWTNIASISGNGWIDFVSLAFSGNTIEVRLTIDGVVQFLEVIADLASTTLYNLVLAGATAQPWSLGITSGNQFIIQQMQIRFQTSFVIDARRTTVTARNLVGKMIIYKISP